MQPDLWSTALQLGIGGLSVAGIIYVSLKHTQTTREIQQDFLRTLDSRADKHEAAMTERESSLRQVEMSVRSMLTEQITKNTVALLDVTKVLGQVIRKLEN